MMRTETEMALDSCHGLLLEQHWSNAAVLGYWIFQKSTRHALLDLKGSAYDRVN